MADGFSGGCACGAVRYTVSSEPVAFMLCHCRDCQFASGGEPAAVVVVPRAAFEMTQGTVKRYAKTSEAGNTVTRQFCPECGTPMFSELGGNPDLWVVKAGTLDDPGWLKPTAFLWTGSAQPWAHLDPALRAFEKQPG